MEYDSILEVKNALGSYSNVTAELEALYKKAKENNISSFENAKKELSTQYAEDKNAAVTKGKLDEKDMNQFLASRGLSTSGESVQAKIDSNISINNSLSSLAKVNASSLSALEQEKHDKENELDTELNEKKLNLEQWKAELTAQFTETKSSSSGSIDNSSPEEEKPTTETYIPETSAKELAKSILATYAADGKITTTLQKSYVKQYLNTLSKKEGVDTDYLKELIINLKAAGYTDITDSSSEATIAAENGAIYYKTAYEQLYGILMKGNRSTTAAEELAVKQARVLMLDYVYKRCATLQTFEKACAKMQITDSELDEYYTRLDNIFKQDKTSLQLGSELNN